MTATELLKQEHQQILKALDVAKREVESIEKTGHVDTQKVNDIVDFIRNFADKWHHEKEEKLLFTKMIDHGMTGKLDPIGFMLEEHEEGRRYVKNIVSAMEDDNCGSTCIKTIKDNLQGYRNLLTVHINKEDMILYPMAEKLLPDEELKELASKFNNLENSEQGQQVHQKYDNLLH